MTDRFADLLLAAARKDPHAEAVVVGHRRWSLEEYALEAARLAEALRAAGLRPGSTVATLLPGGIDPMVTFFALSLLGCLCVPVNVRFKADEAAYLLRDAGVDAVLLSSEHEHRVPMLRLLTEIVASEPALRPALAVDLNRSPVGRRPGWIQPIARFDSAAPALADVRPHGEPGAVLLYSSGTTAQPKGVLIPEAALNRKARGWADVYGELVAGDRLWNPLPFFHIGGITVILAAVVGGATYLTDVHFQAEAALEQIERERATFLFPGFTTILADLVRSPRFAGTDLSSVRTVGVAGPGPVLADLQRAIPHAPFVPMYGSTEGCGIVTCPSRADDVRARLWTVGRPLPGLEVRIDESAASVETGAASAGEIQIRGYCVAGGYLNKPAASAEVAAGDGWLRTGDLGWLDDDGRLHFEGRLKDIVRVGGENLSAAEVETVLQGHQDVVLAQVVSAPDERLGEVPVAFVQLRDGAVAGEDELRELCRQRLARFKVPARVLFVSEWPMSATKVQKFRLRELLPAPLEEAVR